MVPPLALQDFRTSVGVRMMMIANTKLNDSISYISALIVNQPP